jgi:MFS family permease
VTVVSNNQLLLISFIMAIGVAALCAWFADHYHHRVGLWAVLGFLFGVPGLVGMFCSWYCQAAARRKNRDAQIWALAGFVLGLFAVFVMWLLPSAGPPQRPPMPRRPRAGRSPGGTDLVGRGKVSDGRDVTVRGHDDEADDVIDGEADED